MTFYPNSDKYLTLSLSVQYLNNSLSAYGVVPSALFFGEYPPFYSRSKEPPGRPPLDERSRIVSEGRKEMEKHMAKMRVDRALRPAVSPAADCSCSSNDKVLVCR